MDGHLTKIRGGKKGQITPMVRFCVFSSGTGDNKSALIRCSTEISARAFELKTRGAGCIPKRDVHGLRLAFSSCITAGTPKP
jgi:hypothetical protein